MSSGAGQTPEANSRLRTDPLTVAGKTLKNSYDLVLAHEHLLIDIRCYLEADPSVGSVPVTRANADQVRANPMGCEDNLVLDDLGLAADELSFLSPLRALVIDVTPETVGRDASALLEISARTGVDIIMGCGPYVELANATRDRERSAEVWHSALLSQLDSPSPRPSVIGEIGTSDPIAASERAALVGAIRAHRDRDVPLYVHLAPFGRRGHEVLDLVEAEGGDVGRTVLCHLDAQIPNGLDYHRELLDRGCLIAFDVWGYEAHEADGRWPTDEERIQTVAELIRSGHQRRILNSQDVCTKIQLRRFGGVGYDHLWTTIRPALSEAGIGESAIQDLLGRNAMRLLRPRAAIS